MERLNLINKRGPRHPEGGLKMAVPADVLSPFKTGMKSYHHTLKRVIKSLREDDTSALERVFYNFIMSLIVTIVFSSITMTALCGNYFFFANRENSFLVKKLNVLSETETSVRLQWTQPELRAERYEVNIISTELYIDEAFEVDAWTKTSEILGRLTTGGQYLFSVTSFVTYEDGQESPLKSEEIKITMRPSAPGPIDKHKSLVSGAHVELIWEASPGYVESYSVVLKDCYGDVVTSVMTESTHLTISLDKHRLSTAYAVEICSLSHGEKSEPQTHTLRMKDSDLSIQDLLVTTQDSTSATLEWKHPVYIPVQRYEVHRSLAHSSEVNIIKIAANRMQHFVTDLMPGQAYRFKVISVLPMQCGKERIVQSQDVSVTTRPAMPGMVDREKSTIKSTSMELIWQASEGVVDRYIVKIASDSPFREEYETNTPSVVIKNLEVNTRYQLDIYAVSGEVMSEHKTEVLKTKDIEVSWGCLTMAMATGSLAGIGVVSLAPILGAVGFGAAGIGKGTLAAAWMSSYGGTVASGSLFSFLQSLGVVGLGAAAKATIITSGIALGCIAEVV
ncbi:receptor-type tyrosine-protein phosphatase eta-like [Ylistrum balloti]|uniref:receptor-type tyrosine-protein phosphatase eta-like n=1 Tax=Ylistrum balloti TaxID=509963 RepID=UPI002905BB0B|nr:receptor-type tyrosine-protein phosphatase eta-like [Ylistrum balloti]